MVFGINYVLQKYLAGHRIQQKHVEEADEVLADVFGTREVFNREGWEYIVREHQGLLPIEIRTHAEGTMVPQGVPLMTVRRTDPKCCWLPGFLETLLVKLWAPMTVATQQAYQRQTIAQHLRHTGCDPALAALMLVCFGYRGVSSEESAQVLGGAHMTSFSVTDTLAAIKFWKEWYVADEHIGGSIRAYEHSTVTTWGEDGEPACLEHALNVYPSGWFAMPIDSYDYRRFLLEYLPRFKNRILERDGKFVARPDSGDPQSVVVEVCEMLEKTFGSTQNAKGYKLLHPKVGVIYGDGMRPETINQLYSTLAYHGWAASNVAVGSGGGLLQQVNRDTQRFGFKACWGMRGGKPICIQKNPVGDHGKQSKGGFLSVINTGGELTTVSQDVESNEERNELKTVFLNGRCTQPAPRLSEIRRRVEAWADGE
jgi:nicotinamide phosphoribosyltransferase